MRELVFSPKFDRAYRKFVRRNKALQRKVDNTLAQMKQDVFQAALQTHKLSGNLSAFSACSCGYDCRIIFFLETDDSNSEVIILVDTDTHDEVY